MLGLGEDVAELSGPLPVLSGDECQSLPRLPTEHTHTHSCH